MKRNTYCYCNVCSNKTFNHEQTLICNKTGNIPDFKFNCNNYQLDETEYKNVENKLLLAIEKRIKSTDFIEEINMKTELFENEKCQDYMQLSEYMVFKKVSYTFIIIVAPVFVMYIPYFIENKTSYGFILLMIPIMIIGGWLIKKSDINEFNTLILSKEGIQYNQLEYPWDDIMTTYIQHYFYKRLKSKSYGKFLILGLKSGKIVKTIDIQGIRISSRWWKLFSYPMPIILSHYVELYKKGFNHKRSFK